MQCNFLHAEQKYEQITKATSSIVETLIYAHDFTNIEVKNKNTISIDYEGKTYNLSITENKLKG